jgi:hypothetical protein
VDTHRHPEGAAALYSPLLRGRLLLAQLFHRTVVGPLVRRRWLRRRRGFFVTTWRSSATVGEGTQNLLCGYLAIAVLVGLLANTLFSVWWLDPLIALGIAAVAVQEGRKALRGEGCGCASC